MSMLILALKRRGIMMFKEDEYLVLEDNVRHSYMSVVWSHKIQEKQADILTNYYKRLETVRVICAVIISGSLISLIFKDQFKVKLITTFISFISAVISMLFKSFDIQKSITNHKNTANELLAIRNQFQLLLVDIKMKNKDKSELMKIYNNLIVQLDDIYRTAPNTTDKAVKRAENALKIKKDNEFLDEEIDLNLPKSLRRGEA